MLASQRRQSSASERRRRRSCALPGRSVASHGAESGVRLPSTRKIRVIHTRKQVLYMLNQPKPPNLPLTDCATRPAVARRKSLQPGENELLRRELRAWLATSRRSQSEIARDVGVSQQTISSFLKGITGVGPSAAEKIAETMGTTLDEILLRPSPTSLERPPLRVASRSDPDRSMRMENEAARGLAKKLAVAMLEQISDRKGVGGEQLYELAYAALQITVAGRLASSVIFAAEDEPIPYQRMTQLCAAVLAEVRQLEENEPRPVVVGLSNESSESGER